MVAERVEVRGRCDARLCELSAALARLGHDVTVMVRRDDPALPDLLEGTDGIRIMCLTAGPPEPMTEGEAAQYMGAFARALDSRWAADRPDVIHAHCAASGIATQLVARRLDLPVVQTFGTRDAHGVHESEMRDRLRLEAVVARNATKVVATCSDDVSHIVRMGVSRSRVTVVPCGVNVDRFSPEGPIAPRSERHRIVGIGRCCRGAGFDVLVRALPHMPDVELVLAGIGSSDRESEDELGRLRDMAGQAGVADRLLVRESLAPADLPELIRSADVVVCTPMYDSLGATALAAMACGVPVVATAVGAMVDSVVHDVTGWLVPPNQPVDVGRAVNHLIRDEFLRKSFGAAGRDRVRVRYSWDRIAFDTARIYDGLVQTGDQSSASA